MKPLLEAIQMPQDVFPVKTFVRSSSEEGFIFVHPHWHNAVEILYILEGNATQQINDRIFNAGRGALVFITGDQVHSTYTDKNEKNEILVLQFDAELCKSPENFTTERKLIDRFKDIIDIPNPIADDSPVGAEASACIADIHREMCSFGEGYELFVKSCLLKLIGIMVRNFGGNIRVKEVPYRINRAKDMLKNTFSLIDNGYMNEITLHEAVKASNLSTPHFCRMFRKFTGMTFMEYLTFFRTNRAEELLFSARPITEIAYECGFGSLTAFNRAFKRYKGLTPSDYRSRYR